MDGLDKASIRNIAEWKIAISVPKGTGRRCPYKTAASLLL